MGTPNLLAEEIARVHAGVMDGPALLAAFRSAVLIVPTDGHNALLTADQQGVCWVYAFTDESALARFALARGEAGRHWPYLTVLGGRLLDAALPAVGRPAGVVVDVGSEQPAFFPPQLARQDRVA